MSDSVSAISFGEGLLAFAISALFFSMASSSKAARFNKRWMREQEPAHRARALRLLSRAEAFLILGRLLVCSSVLQLLPFGYLNN